MNFRRLHPILCRLAVLLIAATSASGWTWSEEPVETKVAQVSHTNGSDLGVSFVREAQSFAERRLEASPVGDLLSAQTSAAGSPFALCSAFDDALPGDALPGDAMSQGAQFFVTLRLTV